MARGQRQEAADTWLSTKEFASLAGVADRVARRILARAATGSAWRDAQLAVRKSKVPDGSDGSHRYAVLLTSLPTRLQAKYYRQQPGGELREKIADHADAIEQDRRGKRSIPKPWTKEEREARHAAFSQLPTVFQEEAKRRQKAVWFFESLSTLGSSLRERYELAAREAGVSVPTIRRWAACRSLDRGDWIVALAPKRREYYQTAEFSQEARDYIESEYFQLTGPALKSVYRRAVRKANQVGAAIPSYQTVKRWINSAFPHWYHVLKREGQEASERLYPAQQRDYSMLRIHQVWCGDGRKADVFCRFEDGTVSRPIVLAFIDVRTRVFLGYIIGRTESADLIRLSFKAAAERSGALPEEAYIDNGRGFASKMLTGGVPNRFRFKVKAEDPLGVFPLLGIKVIWAQPYAGRSKPIESAWRQLAEAEKRFPGAWCGNRPDAKPEDFDPKNAVPVQKYRELIDATIAEYHERPHRGDAMNGRSPRQCYEELIQQTPVRHPTAEQLRLCLLAGEQVKLDPRDCSVRVLSNRYWSEKLANLSPRTPYTVRFNPEDATEPVAIYQGDRFLCEARLIDRTGFRDQQAAKDHLRAKREFQKARKDEARAIAEKRKAEQWLPSPGNLADTDPSAPQVAVLPGPGVPQLVHMRQQIAQQRGPLRAENTSHGISKDDVRQALIRALQKAG
jgi:hypothetical protein